jgi:hypothetical protein
MSCFAYGMVQKITPPQGSAFLPPKSKNQTNSVRELRTQINRLISQVLISRVIEGGSQLASFRQSGFGGVSRPVEEPLALAQNAYMAFTMTSNFIAKRRARLRLTSSIAGSSHEGNSCRKLAFNY